MRRLRFGFVCTFAYCCLLANNAACQLSTADQDLYSKALQRAINVYQLSSGDQAAILNGSEYYHFPFRFEAGGIAFFQDFKPVPGRVLYDGIQYDSVLLQYDEVQDVVIYTDSLHHIQLLNDRVATFDIFNHHFIRLEKDSLHAPLLQTGFYDQLYKGRLLLLKKEQKIIREEVNTGVLLRFIEPHVYYYIQKDGVLHRINGRKSLLALFPEQRKRIQQYIRKNKLSYRKDPDSLLTAVAAFCDQSIQ